MSLNYFHVLLLISQHLKQKPNFSYIKASEMNYRAMIQFTYCTGSHTGKG